MANPSSTTASPAAAAAAAAGEASRSRSSAAPRLSCLCSPTNHPGSFRCSRHRSPRGRPSSSSGRASPVAPSGTAVPGRSGGRAKGRSVRAHLLQMISPPSGRDHRRRRDFQPRPSRLGLVNT